MRTKLISYVIYPFDLIVLFNVSYSEIETHLKKCLPEEVYPEIRFHFDREIKHGRTAMFTTGQTVIVLNNHDRGLMAHEIFHAVEFLFDRIGCKLSCKSSEAYAYLIQYITNELYKK